MTLILNSDDEPGPKIDEGVKNVLKASDNTSTANTVESLLICSPELLRIVAYTYHCYHLRSNFFRSAPDNPTHFGRDLDKSAWAGFYLKFRDGKTVAAVRILGAPTRIGRCLPHLESTRPVNKNIIILSPIR